MNSLLENLNKEQLEAVTHRDGSLLIIAGAGTGKTTVITRRFAWLVEQKLAKPEEILAITFTDKASGEMEDRIIQLMPIGAHDLWVSTFHGFCERVLRQYGLDIGLPAEFNLFDEVRQWSMVYKNLDRFKLAYYKPLGNPYRFIDALLSHFSKCKDETISPESYLEYAQNLQLNNDNAEFALLSSKEDESTALDSERITELANAFHVYQKLLLENEALDFGDLINYTLDLFKKRPNVLKVFQQKFKFVLVDEFQDTNFAQYELIKLLTHSSTASLVLPTKGEGIIPSSPPHEGELEGVIVNSVSAQNTQTSPSPSSRGGRLIVPHLTVVGDDDQSIYKFRGASVSNIMHFIDDYPNAKQITLSQNYRSYQNILDLAYNFIQLNNPDRLEVKLGIEKRLLSNKPGEAEIQVFEGTDLSDELLLVVNKLISIKSSNVDATWNDFAILIRANTQALELLPKLEAVGVPFTYLSNTGLYKKPLIAFLINYLKFLINFHESFALFKVLNLEKFKLDTKDLSNLTHLAHKRTTSVFEVLQSEEFKQTLDEPSLEKTNSLLELIKNHSKLVQEKSAVETFVTIIHDLEIAKLVEEETLENNQNREWLDQFYKKIENYEQETDQKSITYFVEDLELEMKAGGDGAIKFDPMSGPESVKVLTVHSSKGLEFDYVFLPGLVDQRFPSRKRSEGIPIVKALIKDFLPEGDEHLQEERRLFYVAVTRARSKLFFSWAKDYGGARTRKPSIFLVESGMLPSSAITKSTGKVVFNKTQKNEHGIFQELPTRFSFSELNTFIKCPLEYKYKYYLKIPLQGSAALSFGVTIHTVFEKYVKEYLASIALEQTDLFGTKQEPTLPPKNRLYELYESCWVDEWYSSVSQKDRYRTLGKKMLEHFYDNTSTENPKILHLELPFKVHLNGYDFAGKIDRIDAYEDGIRILDYKTGSPPKNGKNSNFDQLRVYQWAMTENLSLNAKQLCYWYLEENEFLTVPTATNEEIGKIHTFLLDTANKIRDCVQNDSFSELHEKSPKHDCAFDW